MPLDDLTAMLRCPDDQSELSLAEPEVVQRINAAIRGGRLRNCGGQPLEETIDGGLVRAAGDRLYPIVDHIPVLLQDEAIPLAQLDQHGPE